MKNSNEQLNGEIEAMEAEAKSLEAEAAAVKSANAAWPDLADRPSRRARDKADMRVVALCDAKGPRLEIQTRRPTWALTLFAWGAVLVGFLGLAATLPLVGPSGSLTGVLGAVTVGSCCVVVVGFASQASLWPDGSPRTWRAHRVEPAVLADLIETLGKPHRGDRCTDR